MEVEGGEGGSDEFVDAGRTGAVGVAGLSAEGVRRAHGAACSSQHRRVPRLYTDGLAIHHVCLQLLCI